MPLKFFQVSIRDMERSEQLVNSFLANHAVLSVERQWVDVGLDSYWSICIDYLIQSPSSVLHSKREGIRSRVDYRETLTSEQFVVFAKLRDLRKALAQQEGVPVYTVFTNDQLAQMVTLGITTKAELGKVEGIGEARIDRYAEQFLQTIQALSGVAKSPPNAISEKRL